MGKLKRNVCEAESDCILFRVPRGDCIVGSDCAAPARVGNESFTAGARVEFRGDFIVLALAGAGGRGSPGERVSARPDWVGRSGRGMALVSRNGKGRGNAIVSGSGEVETECLCSGKRLFFISNTARGLFHKKRLDSTRAGRERKFHGRSACGVSRKFIASSLAGRVTDSSGSRGGAGSPIEGKQKAFVPPPAGRAGRVPRESFRGKCGVSPAGFASRGGIASPLRGTRRPPLGASGALPPRFARLRGRGLPRFCRLHHVGPLRPGTMFLSFPIRAGEFFVFSLYNRRAPRLQKLPFPIRAGGDV